VPAQYETIACQTVVELVTDYLDSALTPAAEARVEAHLAGCPDCSAHLDQTRTTIRALGHLADRQVNPAARHELVCAFEFWRLHLASL
jgi:anti-sigma factor RsiW